jgi:hypothetical protein
LQEGKDTLLQRDLKEGLPEGNEESKIKKQAF